MEWQDIFIVAVSSAGISTASIAGLSKIVIKFWFGKDLEKFKADLLRVNSEHSVKFGKLHEERAIAIKDLYKRLNKLCEALNVCKSEYHIDTVKKVETVIIYIKDSFNSFSECYLENKLYFDTDTDRLIHEVLELAGNTLFECEFLGESYDVVQNVALDTLEQRSSDLSKSVELLKTRLEARFKELLGVN